MFPIHAQVWIDIGRERKYKLESFLTASSKGMAQGSNQWEPGGYMCPDWDGSIPRKGLQKEAPDDRWKSLKNPNHPRSLLKYLPSP